MRARIAALAALLLLSGPLAAAPRGYLDLYGVPSSEIEVSNPGLGGDADDDGTGLGVKGLAPAGGQLVLTGEYQTVDYGGDGELNQLRAGLGLVGRRGGGVLVEYVSFDEAVEADGLGLHLRLGARNFYGQIGYLALEDDVEDATGVELAAGFAASLTRELGAFFDVRHTALEGDDSGVEHTITDLRVGLRLTFRR